MGFAFFYGLPIILIGASAFLGVFSLLFFTSGLGQDQEMAALWLPVSICAVVAVSYLMSTSSTEGPTAAVPPQGYALKGPGEAQ